MNCAALPEQLLESELFGYERGAFTGAHKTKPGQIELASTGVLFLDEVTEMNPLPSEVAARASGTRVPAPRGHAPVQADVRVIAATNRDLRRAVQRGSFAKTYYRLRVFDIQLPPLRQRATDIIPLSDTLSAGDRQILRTTGRWTDARGTSRASPLRVAGQRARASQCLGTGGDPL